MKVVDIERVVILMRFIQFGWDEERKKSFDDNLRMMLETQCEDLEEHDKQIREEVIEEVKGSINEHLFNSPMMNPIMTRNEILLFLEQLK